MADLRPQAQSENPKRYQQVLQWVQSPQISPAPGTDPDETLLFSTGVHALEQHSQLLRAVEGRIQQYRDFLTLCTTALTNVQNDLQGAQSLLTQLNNDLTSSRQNLAYVLMLLADEQTRVASVNITRLNVLNTYVRFIAYTRPRTVINLPNAPSRQLVPANVASPVPACLKQSLAIPPELREMVALLREGAVSWFPVILSQLNKLERPALLEQLASDTQSRATMMLATPLRASSAASSSGVFAPAIATTYSSDQQVFRTLQTQRAAFQPATIAGESWRAQIGDLGNIAAVADLTSSSAVHAEVSSAAARFMQQISSVATCLYTRIGQALPIDRLTWAQFLQANPSAGLQNLATLPNWNSQNYIDRQQMQLLVDWLFQQVDTNNRTAVALMNDVVEVAILLASDAPVDGIIAGAVVAKTTPVVGHPIRLTLPSDRIAQGMYVNLYSLGTLTARAVVSDLDSSGVTATITDIYQPSPTLAANDVAHYSTQDPNAVVYKAFS
jgi:hypothetical protein